MPRSDIDATLDATRLRCQGISCADDARSVAALLASNWAAKILENLHFAGGTLRFNPLRSALGISAKELSRQLKKLELRGLVTRRAYGVKAPLRVEYSLTRAGDQMLDVLESLAGRPRT